MIQAKLLGMLQNVLGCPTIPPQQLRVLCSRLLHTPAVLIVIQVATAKHETCLRDVISWLPHYVTVRVIYFNFNFNFN